MAQHQVKFNAHNVVFERKFNIALRKAHGDSFAISTLAGKFSTDDDLLVCTLRLIDPHIIVEDIQTNVNIFPSLFLKLYEDTGVQPRANDLRRCFELTKMNLNVQIGWNVDSWKNSTNINYTKLIDNMCNKFAGHKFLYKVYLALTETSSLLSLVTSSLVKKERKEEAHVFKERLIRMSHSVLPVCEAKVAWSRRSCCIRVNGIWYYLPRVYLLMIHNKFADILSVMLMSAFTPYEIYREDMFTVTMEFLHAWAKLSSRLNQKFFGISKVLEALAIGLTLEEKEGISNASFLETIITGIMSSDRIDLKKEKFYTLLSRVSIPVRHELSCLSKTMGHPFCDIKKGAESLHNKVCEPREVDPEAVAECIRYAKEDFVKHYIKRHKSWPPCEIQHGCPRSLSRAVMFNKDPTTPSHVARFGATPLRAYDTITLLPIKEFDWVENFIPLIKDRTISMMKNDVIRKYINNDTSFDVDWRSTRLLLFYLLWPDRATDHTRYLQAFIDGRWEQVMNYLVIRIVPKEKEHKIDARGFGCKTFQDRARSIIQEKNVAEILDLYSQEHVMTVDELGLAKKLLAFRSLKKAYMGYRSIVVSVDASAWNNRFRHDAVAPLMQETLDRMFDTPIFSKTHEAYERSFIYMPDQDQVYSWDGQLGGIEGLNQYTWVYTYIHQIKVCMQTQPYPYYILCKGDDLRIAVMISPQVLEEVPIDDLKTTLLDAVSDVGKKFGHVIKVEDSYASECYFTFSKDAYVDGVEQSQGFRKIQKCYGANNAFLELLDDYVGSSMSNAHSASKVSPSPVICYAVGLWWTFNTLTSSSEYKELSDTELVALTLVPNMLGGFPIIYLHNIFVRAESDLFPSFLHLLQYTQHHWSSIFAVLKKFTNHVVTPAERSLATLMADIYTLPIVRPQTAATIIRRAASELVEKKTKNKAIKSLFKASRAKFEQQLLNVFNTSNVYNVKLMSSIYDCTPEAVVRELVRKFESGRSVYDALVVGQGKGSADRIIRLAIKADKRLHAFRKQIIKARIPRSKSILPDEWDNICPAQLAKVIRDELWQKPVESVTQPPIQHHVIGGDFKKVFLEDYATINHFEVFHVHPSGDQPHLMSIGERQPYVGSKTGKGLSKPSVSFDAHNIMVNKVRTLLDVARWSNITKIVDNRQLTSNLQNICAHMIHLYTGRTLQDLLPYSGDLVINKTVQHHVRANNYRTAIVPNTLLNIYTTMVGNLQSNIFFKSSIEHYLVNFLHIMTHIISLIALPWWLGDANKLIARVWAIFPMCNYCLTPLEEVPVILEDTMLPHFSFERQMSISTYDIKKIQDEIDNQEMPEYYNPIEDEDPERYRYACQGVVDHLLARCWAGRIELQSFYTKHHMTRQAAATLAGWEGKDLGSSINMQDLRSIPIRLIVTRMIPLVYVGVIRRFPTLSDVDRKAALAHTPSEELPWYQILEILNEAERFHEFMRELYRLSPTYMPLIADNPRSVTGPVGSLLHDIFKRDTMDLTLINLGYEANPELSSSFLLRLEAFRWRYLDTAAGTLLLHARQTGAAELVIEATEVLMSLCMIDDIEIEEQIAGVDVITVQTHLFPETDISEYIEARLVNRDECTHESKDHPALWSYEEFFSADEFAQRAYKRYEIGWVTLQVYVKRILDDPDLYTRRRREAFRTVPDVELTVVKMDPVTCLNIVKRVAQNREYDPVARHDNLNEARLQLRRYFGLCVGFSRQQRNVGGFERPPNYPDNWPALDDVKLPVLSDAVMSRPIGQSNFSMSRLAAVLSGFRIYELPKDSLYVCFADGYGGHSAVVASITRDSTVVFNTKPDNTGSLPSPVIAEYMGHENGTTIDTTELSRGIYDITDDGTMTRLQSLYKGVTLVSLDIELKEEREGRRQSQLTSAYRNVIKFFIANGLMNSVLILKFLGRDLSCLLPSVSGLLITCSTVMFVVSPASHPTGELHLVAQKCTSDAIVTSSWGYPNQAVCQKLRRFEERYMIWRSDMIRDKVSVKLARPGWFNRVFRKLPCYGWTKVSEVLKLPVPLSLTSRRHRQYHVWTRECVAFFTNYLEGAWNDLYNNIPDTQRHAYATVRHTFVIMERILIAEGIKYLVLTSELTHDRAISRIGVINGYRQVVARMPRRCGMTDTVDEQIDGPLKIHGIMVDPYGRWQEATRWGISIVSYVL